MKTEFITKITCPQCESKDTMAILANPKAKKMQDIGTLFHDKGIGVLWCRCGLITIRTGKGMQVYITRDDDS